jgi:predicted lipoprotein with Yx(FWY)xxD motif
MANFRGTRVGMRLGALGGLALVATLALAACGGAGGTGGVYGGGGGGGGSSSVAVNLHCASGAVVCTKSVSVNGKATTALANTDGMTLYYFTPDSATSATCNGPCALIWPPLAASSANVMGTSLTGALGEFHSANGEQVEYNGHPLYHYSGDRSQSDATGEGIEGKWFVATPSLQVGNSAPAAPTRTPSNGGYGGGY